MPKRVSFVHVYSSTDSVSVSCDLEGKDSVLIREERGFRSKRDVEHLRYRLEVQVLRNSPIPASTDPAELPSGA